MTKPCLPYTGQFADNIKRTEELYPPDRKSFAIGGSKSLPQTGRDWRSDLNAPNT